DEPEPAGPAGLAVRDHLRPRHRPVLGEELQQVVLGGLPGEIADVDVRSHAGANGTVVRSAGTPGPRPASRTGTHPRNSPGTPPIPSLTLEWCIQYRHAPPGRKQFPAVGTRNPGEDNRRAGSVSDRRKLPPVAHAPGSLCLAEISPPPRGCRPRP